MQHIKNVLLLIRSFKEANIDLLIVALEEVVPLFFPLDHVNHVQWLSVFIQDLKDFSLKLSSLYEKFKKGHFVVNTRGNTFLKLAMGQAQEHNNKNIKSSSGHTDLVNKDPERLLQKSEVCLPEVHSYLNNDDGLF